MTEWQPIETLKDHSEPIVYLRKGQDKWTVGIAYWTVSQKWNPGMESKHCPDGFTHWMPLPEPPQ